MYRFYDNSSLSVIFELGFNILLFIGMILFIVLFINKEIEKNKDNEDRVYSLKVIRTISILFVVSSGLMILMHLTSYFLDFHNQYKRKTKSVELRQNLNSVKN